MALADKLPPSGADFLERHTRLDPQNVIRIRCRIRHKARFKAAERSVGQIENLGHAQQKRIFTGMISAIRHSDVEQPLHQIAQRALILTEHRTNALGIFFKARDVLTGKVEYARRALFIFARDVEDFAKGHHLVAGHQTIRLGHLGRKRNHGNGEGHGLFRR